MNGLAPSMLINFNNGTPNQEERQLIENRIKEKFSGSSNAGKFILAFNDNKESQAEITPVQLSDAHNQYQFLSEESQSKIQVAHRIVSPFLLGIRTASGFSSNADEIKTSSLLMDNTVIRPFQELLIDSFDDILSFNNISLNLYFTTLQPLEFTEVDSSIQDKETIEEETGVEMQKFNLKKIDGKQAYETEEEANEAANELGCSGSHEMEIEGKIYFMPCENHEELKAPCWDGYEQRGMKEKDGKQVPNCVKLETELSDAQGEDLLSTLTEQTLDEDYELVSVRELNDENESIEDWAKSNIKKKLSIIEKLKSGFIKSNPNGESFLDKSFYKIRYTYQEKVSSADSRNFCKTMMGRTSKGVVYRKEDIDNASFQGINNSFGHKGENYSLFKFKGGIYCGHFWQEELYRMKSKTEKYISRGKKVDSIPNKYQPKGIAYQDAKIAPINMPDRGAYPKQ